MSDNDLNEVNLKYRNIPNPDYSKILSGIETGYDVFKSDKEEIPKLLEPFFQKVGLASVVGSSDTGKSSFLRQLALSIVLKKDKFLDFKLNINHGSVVYVSTEDEFYSTKGSITKQLKELKTADKEIENLKNLFFLFEFDYLIERLEFILNNSQIDLIVIDSFADVFTDDLNSNTKVREFLNAYNKLAIKYGTLIIFLHHLGKRSDYKKSSKDNIIGSQGFEAKMRSVVEIRGSKNTNERKLTVLKCNFLPSSIKKESFLLEFNSNLIFRNKNIKVKSDIRETIGQDPELIKLILELNKEGLSYRAISEKLKVQNIKISKSTIGKIINSETNKNRD